MSDFRKIFPRRPYIDGEFLYDYYWRVMGSARSTRGLVEISIEKGMLNPKTGKPPNWTGCWKAIWRWALLKKNHQKAYDIFNTAMADEGLFYTMDQFKEMLVKMYKDAYQPRRYSQKVGFFKRNDLSEFLDK